MSTSPDLPRLHATLGDPRLARLLTLLQRRAEQGIPLTGSATLTAVTSAERAASDELLGRRPTSGAALTVDLDALAARLREAGICSDLASAVSALRGQIVNRKALALEREAAWSAVWSSAEKAFAAHSVLQPWLEKLARLGLLRRLCNDQPAQAGALISDIARTAGALPASAEPLASFAARLFGDAHALDPGTPRATLAVRAAARLGGVHFQDDGEGRRAAWASVGVMCDELSTPALVFNLAGADETPLTRLLRHAGADGEPLHVSLRLLLRWPLANDPGLAGQRVFVCENPTLIALAATRIGRGCAPLVCVNGQFATPSLVLLRQLRAAGAQLYYHGDFDPAGLVIARRVMAESGAQPWRYGASDYRAAPKTMPFAGTPGATPWDEGLRKEMSLDGRAVHEEAVFDYLAQDLAGSCSESELRQG